MKTAKKVKIVRGFKKQKVKKIYLCTILGWFFGIILMLGSLRISLNLFGSILYFLAGLIIFPPFGNYLKEKFNLELSRGLRITISLILLVFIFVFIIDVSTNLENNNLKVINQNIITYSDKCYFTNYQCNGKNIISCKSNGNFKDINVEKTCLRSCSIGHCVYIIGDTIIRKNIGVNLVSAQKMYILPKNVSGYVISNPQNLFKVRIKVTNTGSKGLNFIDPFYNLIILDELGNQYEPTFFIGNDPNKKEFGSSSIFPGVTKIGDVYFKELNNNASRIRIILKDSFFETYTNSERKGFFEDKSFEWVKNLN